MTSTAHKIAAALHDDGQCFEAEDGRTFDELVSAEKPHVQYAGPAITDGDGRIVGRDVVNPGDHAAGDPVRYQFADGSAIVLAGAAWDIEGSEPFWWAGAQG